MSKDELLGRLTHIEGMLESFLQREQVRDWHTTEPLAQLVGKSEDAIAGWPHLAPPG